MPLAFITYILKFQAMFLGFSSTLMLDHSKVTAAKLTKGS